MISWIIWGIVLLVQQGSQTLVARARNSANLKYHTVAALLSNGVWFGSQVVIVSKITDALASGDYWRIAGTLVFYTTFCVVGSVSMHHFLMKKVEKC